jgi:surface protein
MFYDEWAEWDEFQSFDEDIGGWVTSQVWNMGYMFMMTDEFNQDISGWDTSRVTFMNGMFLDAAAFSQDISPWCVALISSEPSSFGNAGGENPVWGDSDNCPTPCDTGANGDVCQNGGTATGVTPVGSSVMDTCSCTCSGESAAERAMRASRASEPCERARERAREARCNGTLCRWGPSGYLRAELRELGKKDSERDTAVSCASVSVSEMYGWSTSRRTPGTSTAHSGTGARAGR